MEEKVILKNKEKRNKLVFWLYLVFEFADETRSDIVVGLDVE